MHLFKLRERLIKINGNNEDFCKLPFMHAGKSFIEILLEHFQEKFIGQESIFPIIIEHRGYVTIIDGIYEIIYDTVVSNDGIICKLVIPFNYQNTFFKLIYGKDALLTVYGEHIKDGKMSILHTFHGSRNICLGNIPHELRCRKNYKKLIETLVDSLKYINVNSLGIDTMLQEGEHPPKIMMSENYTEENLHQLFVSLRTKRFSNTLLFRSFSV